MNKGKLYGISVGPGDSELLTLKAVRLINQVDIIATPRTKGENTLALDIVSDVVDLTKKEIVHLDFLMSRDTEKMQQRHQEIANTLKLKLDQNIDIAMLNLGDISVYSTFSYIMEILLNDGYDVEVVPGVTSFSAIGATLKQSLTTMNEPLCIIPASTLDDFIELKGTKVVMKIGKNMDKVKDTISKHNLQNNVKAISNCGLSNQKICENFDELENNLGYFTTIVIR